MALVVATTMAREGVNARPMIPGRKGIVRRGGRVDADHAFAAGDGGGHVQAALIVEGQALRTARPPIEDFHFAVARNAVNGIEAGGGGAGHVEIAVGPNARW